MIGSDHSGLGLPAGSSPPAGEAWRDTTETHRLGRQVAALRQLLNDQYLSMIRFCLTLPLGGRDLAETLLEETAALHVRASLESELFRSSYSLPKGHLSAAQSLRFISRIHVREGVTEEGWFELEEQGNDEFTVDYSRSNCTYVDHCSQLAEDGLECICVRRFFYGGIAKVMARTDLATQLISSDPAGDVCRLAFRPRRVTETQADESRVRILQAVEENARLRRARAEAVAASQAKSEFLAMMSHEIRSPLNGLLGAIQLLQCEKLDPMCKDLMDVVRRSGHALNSLIGDILDVTKIEAGQLKLDIEPMELLGVVQEVVTRLRPRAEEKGLGLDVRVAAGVPESVEGDPGRLGQILSNLVGNAIKFTSTGGIVLHVLPEESDRIRFEVVDSGPGLADEVMEQVFTPFFQVDSTSTRRHQGAGLGLAIARKLAEAMGGSIGVKSSGGGSGSCFWFVVALPSVGSRPGASCCGSVKPATPVWSVPGHRPRILLVEDNEINQLIAQKMLERLGCACEVASDGPSALELFRRRGFDLVLMDCQLPDLDGFDTTRAIRRHEQATGLRPTPILALTAYAMSGDRERCLAAGMDAYLSKPVSLVQLDRSLRDFLGEPEGDPEADQACDPVEGELDLGEGGVFW